MGSNDTLDVVLYILSFVCNLISVKDIIISVGFK